METYYGSIKLLLIFLIILIKCDYTLFTNVFISQLISYNASQTLRFEHIITHFLTSMYLNFEDNLML
jgi:hypothetical protein